MKRFKAYIEYVMTFMPTITDFTGKCKIWLPDITRNLYLQFM